MTRIHKYHLEITAVQKVRMPLGARLLSVVDQRGLLYLWALVDDNVLSAVWVEICIVGIVSDFPDHMQWPHFIGTVVMSSDAIAPPLVWHVFARTPYAE